MKPEKPIYSIPELEVVLFEEDVLTTSVEPLGISFHGDSTSGDQDNNSGTGTEVDYGGLPFNQ